MRRFFKDETGAYLVTEATFVFPITFFIILIIMFLGNNMFLRAAVQSVAAQAASYGVRTAVDPLAGSVSAGQTVGSMGFNAQPYHHYGFFGGTSSAEAEAKAIELADKKMAEDVGTGFFAGTLVEGSHTTTAGYSFGVLKNKFTVTIKYDTDIPIRMIFSDKQLGFYHTVTASISGADPKEMIDLANTAMDYMDRTKFGETARKISAKIKKFFP